MQSTVLQFDSSVKYKGRTLTAWTHIFFIRDIQNVDDFDSWLLCNASISRGAEDLMGCWRLRQFPGNGMLTPAGPNHEHIILQQGLNAHLL